MSVSGAPGLIAAPLVTAVSSHSSTIAHPASVSVPVAVKTTHVLAAPAHVAVLTPVVKASPAVVAVHAAPVPVHTVHTVPVVRTAPLIPTVYNSHAVHLH